MEIACALNSSYLQSITVCIFFYKKIIYSKNEFFSFFCTRLATYVYLLAKFKIYLELIMCKLQTNNFMRDPQDPQNLGL